MKLLANENIPYPSIFYLRDKGYDITSIGMENPSLLDSQIMDIAIEEGRTIVTFDRDYGELIFRHNYKPNNGVIYLRLSKYSPVEPGVIVERLINAKFDFTKALTVVDEHGVRQRKF